MADALATPLLRWFAEHGRHDLPWQTPATPYRVWVSEIMLQQTQVSTVIPYFERFMAAFPALADLAMAPLDAVLSHWAGLGYYARAHRLHACADIVLRQYGGEFPTTLAALMALPGIGRSTAGAILALGQGADGVILDGNVRRVLARYHALPLDARSSPAEKLLWGWAHEHTPHDRAGAYAQAIMDLGATLCKPYQPECPRCPLKEDCQAYRRADVTAYPRKRIRQERAIRQRQALLIHDAQGRIWLQRRPNRGLWAGLFSWPECEAAEQDLRAWLEQHQLDPATLEKAGSLQHDFTHYRLHLQLWTLAAPTFVAEKPGIWYALGTEKPALPAPVERYLEQRWSPACPLW